MASKPLIGLTPGYFPKENAYWHMLKEAYSNAVWKAGGIPMLLTYPESEEKISEITNHIQGLLMSGGPDLPINIYGGKEYDMRGEGPMHNKRTTFDEEIFNICINKKIPVLGICASLQHINVLYGGTLYEDLETHLPKSIDHGYYKGPIAYHPVNVTENSLLHKIFGEDTVRVSSTHHQGIKILGDGIVATAITSDGLIEGIESVNGEANFIAVQWHPEIMQDDPIQMKLFEWLVKSAENIE
tara:strand:+ start:49312 stop:50037 length:726 start_codon:yes stop_codon:yes gene_type:complete